MNSRLSHARIIVDRVIPTEFMRYIGNNPLIYFYG